MLIINNKYFNKKEVVDLSTVKMIILDEVDKLLSIHFMPVTEKIFEYLSKEVQILLFSATYPKETTMKFQKKYIPDPHYVNMMVQNEVTLKGVTQYYAYIEEREKLHCLNTLFSKLQINQCIIFCHSVKRVELLSK